MLCLATLPVSAAAILGVNGNERECQPCWKEAKLWGNVPHPGRCEAGSREKSEVGPTIGQRPSPLPQPGGRFPHPPLPPASIHGTWSHDAHG